MNSNQKWADLSTDWIRPIESRQLSVLTQQLTEVVLTCLAQAGNQ